MSRPTSFRLGALAVLLVILGASLLLWPLPSLGANFDLQSGVVLAVQPASSADSAGLLVGDRVIQIYGYPWLEVNTRLLLLPLPWQEGTPTPVTVERGSTTKELIIENGVPSLALQFEKMVRALIALVCWGTGFLLGTSPRAVDLGLRWTGWFWVWMAGALSLYPLTQITSYVLTVAVLWFLCTVLAPVAVAVQCWYPPRPASLSAQRRSRRLLLGAIGIGQFVALYAALVAPATTVLYEQFLDSVRFVFLVSFGLSAFLLFRAHASTPVAHIRRQIRLIGAACVLACAWAALLILVRLVSSSLEALVPPAAFPLGGILIPLSYLAGGVGADLMRLDQVVRRVLLHTLTILTSLTLLVVGEQSGLLVLTPALVVLVAVLLYAPLYRLIQHRVAPIPGEARRDKALREAVERLRSSLDATYLIDTLGAGIRGAFLSPPLAIYHRMDPESDTLARVVDQQLNVPPTLEAELVERWKQHGALILPAVQVQQSFQHEALRPNTASLVFHSSIVMWGLICDQSGKLLSIVLFGPRGDDEPYLQQNLRELEQLLGTATLALTNSASYTAQVVARAELRELRAHAEQIEEQTRAEIAGEIHDNVLSTQLRLNRENLASLIQAVTSPELHERLADVAAGEETIGDTLRLVCEQLKPTGQDDPLGLVVSLRLQANWFRSNWRVSVTVQVEHDPVPLTQQLNRALVKIAQEAVTNAVTHGQPTKIVVHALFPTEKASPLVLTIVNDGPRLWEPIEPRRNHWGVRNMREYADAVGATIRWDRPEQGGVCVVVSVPPEVLAHISEEVQASDEAARAAQDESSEQQPGRARAVGRPGTIAD